MDDRSETEALARQRIDDRMFDAELAEVLGVPVADDLGERGETAARIPRRRWLEAALVVLGLAVTAAIVLQRPSEPIRRPAQSPVDLEPPQPLPTLVVTTPGDSVGRHTELESLIYEWHPEANDLDALLPCQMLRYLWLTVGDPDGRGLDADCLEPLAQLPRLETLTIGLSDALDSERLKVLRSMPRLRFLTLTLGRPLAAGDFALLRSLEHVVGLELQGLDDGPTGIDARTIRELASMPGLQSLGLKSLAGCDEPVLRELRAFHGLRRLALSGMGPQPVAERLDWKTAAKSSGLTESVARCLAELPLLEDVWLEGAAVTPAAIRALPDGLSGFRLTRAPDAGPDVYRAIGELSGLRRLGLGRAIPARPYTQLANSLPTAEEVEQSGMPPREPVFVRMAELLRTRPLTEFYSEYPSSPQLRAALADAEHLKRIRLVYGEAADVEAAAKAPNLTHLRLESCSGFAVEPLQAARSLRELHLRWGGVASEEWLRKELAGVRVIIEN